MRKSFITGLLLLVVFIAGCGEGSNEQTQRSAFLGGTNGAIAQFELFGVQEDGIQAIFDTETFPIEVRVTNKGEYEIQPGEIVVELLGPSEAEFAGIPSRLLENVDTIEKISELNPEGGEEIIPFAEDAQFVEEVTNYLDREWFANMEFYYETELVIPEVCLKEDLTDDRVCEVREPKTFFVSGAPITISAVEQDTSGRGIMALKITVQNAGTGDVTIPGEEFDDTRDELAYFIDDPAWECKSAGKVNEARLFNNEATIVCKLTDALPEDTLATKQVKLTLQYVYRDLVSQKLRIKEST